jgi:hypothetical protein
MRKNLLKQVPILAAVACALALTACEYDVPITATPTRQLDARLLGNWTIVTPQKSEQMKIRRFDDWNYIVSIDGGLLRAHHSDLGGMPLVSVQSIEDAKRKYSYVAWVLSDDGNRLTIKTIRESLVPKETKDTATVVRLIESNRENPQLFEESSAYTRDPK